jgi:Tfp pilus assembly protein PilF
VERAVAAEDWQAAYDAARALPPSGAASYVRLLLVAARLRELGAPDAALSLLERAMDCAPDNQLVYWELVRTLTDLGRYAEAQLAVEALQGTAKQAA